MGYFKPIERSLSTVNERRSPPTRLSTCCRKNVLFFLIDWATDISAAVPTSPSQKKAKPIALLYAANETSIAVYERRIMELNIGLRQSSLWDFCVADIDRPILGIDFVSSYNLLIHPAKKLLIDDETKLELKCLSWRSDTSGLCAILPSEDIFFKLLKYFPHVTFAQNTLFLPPVTSNVRHHIITTGPPVSCRPRRLSPYKLKIAKKEIQLLLQRYLSSVRQSLGQSLGQSSSYGP